jgi:hypothetical protein
MWVWYFDFQDTIGAWMSMFYWIIVLGLIGLVWGVASWLVRTAWRLTLGRFIS